MSSTVTASARQYTAANSEYHSITNAAQVGLDPGTNTSFYMCGWIYMDSYPSFPIIMGKGDASNGYHVYMDSSTLHFINRSGAKNVAGGTISLSTWTFWEAYYDSVGDVIAVCINRGSDSTLADTVGPTTSAIDFLISHYPSASNYVNGRMCSMVFINGMPATADRDAIYNSGSGVLYKDKPTLSSGTYVSWWDGAETSGSLRDAHGTNHLTDNNTVTSAVGKVTYTAEDASQFTAANSEYLSVATSGDLVPGDFDFSVTGWIYLDATGTDRGIVSVLNYGGAYGSNYSWVVFYKGSNNFITLDVDSLGTVAAGYTRVSSAVPVAASKWYFFAARHDATANTIEIRVNNETYVSAAHSNGAYAGNAPFRISGYGITTMTAFWNGRIANVNYWKSKISDSLTDEIYQRGFGRDYTDFSSTTGLVGSWPLTEASGDRADEHGTFTLTDNATVTGAAGVVYDVPAVVSSSTKSLALLGVG